MFRTVLAAAVTLAGPGLAQDRKDPAVVKLDPEAFAAEVKKDEKAAAVKYKDKAIELSGTVIGVQRTLGGDVFLSLPSKTAGILGVNCFLQDKNVFGKVVKGQEVTVRGRYPDLQSGIQLMDCELVKVGPSPALTYMAETMAREWVNDKEAATRKWKNKVIVVSGEVGETQANDVGAINVYLNAGEKLRVDCGFTAFEKDIAAKLKKGDKVKVVGEFVEFESKDEGPALRFCMPVAD
jgi:tRNA(Ile2) C34 agmatinyltransferase TiaS